MSDYGDNDYGDFNDEGDHDEGEHDEGERNFGGEESEFDDEKEFGEESGREDDMVFEEDREELAEVNAYERAGGSLISSYSLKSARNPKEKFAIILSATLQKMQSGYITENDKSTILHSIANRDDIIYKNPTAYILGYIGSRGGQGITKDSMSKAFNSMGSAIGVEEPDVVRYSVFWVNMTKK